METTVGMIERGLNVMQNKIKPEHLTTCSSLAMESEMFKSLSDEGRQRAVHCVETVILDVVRQVSEGKDPELHVPKVSDWHGSGNTSSNDGRDGSKSLHKDVAADAVHTRVRLSVPASRRKFALLVLLLSRVHKMLGAKTTCTRRQIYYEQVSWLRSQREVDDGVVLVARILGMPPWQLGLIATAKGLVAGNLVLRTTDDERLDCANRPGGVLIPSDVTSIESLESSARFVLLLEKDTIFQRLLDENATNTLGPCILVTGKGYPDMGTRVLLARIVSEFNIPVLAVVDADPHGVHIMCVYRFGTKNVPLALPRLRWLGLLPSEIGSLGVRGVPLTPHDVALAKNLLGKPYTKDTPELQTQIETMLSSGKKAEVDALTTISSCYLTDIYIPEKIGAAEVI